MSNFSIYKEMPDSATPLLVHIPHSSTSIPSPYRSQFLLSAAALDRELLAMTDRYTDELFADHAVTNGGSAFVNSLSRLVFDPERFEDDALEKMSEKGMGAVYTTTSDLGSLRAPDFPTADRETILRDLFRPYSDTFSSEVSSQLDRFGRCLIIDAHSFPSTPLPYEDSTLDRPDLCIGYDDFHSSETLIAAIERIGLESGWSVGRNVPFAGSYVPLAYYRTDPRVVSVMLEINRGRYMDETTGDRSVTFEDVRGLVGRLIGAAVLFEAFRNTRFDAEIPSGDLCIRIGERSPRLDALLNSGGHHSWAYITAHNPNGQTASDPENERAQNNLKRDLGSSGFAFYAGEGKADVGDWPAEPSLLVIGIGQSEALMLGNRYGQAAVVVGEQGQPARLLACNPD